ncbi:low molecular weight protein arginine phosphatase [Bacillus tianshenii]|nr:low molecular weight protein arginine phosphatase [Bacillus tianshenii]
MKNVLFVCTGNTCRSPMAEAIFNKKAAGKFEAKSAGVFASDGSEASPQSLEVLKEKGIEFVHSSSSLQPELIDWADLILTMTTGHKQMLLMHVPESTEKVYVLREFVETENENPDISDPFGGSVEQYRDTLLEIDVLIDKLIEKLSKTER